MLVSRLTSKKIIFIAVLLIILVVSFLSFSAFKSYSIPTLIGKWKSLETGQEISFTEDGLVTFKDTTKVGTYTILSSSKMEYTIDNKTFIMYYYLEEKHLSWGIDEKDLELFTKKFIFREI